MDYSKEDLEQALRDYIETVGKEEGACFIGYIQDNTCQKSADIVNYIFNKLEPTKKEK